MRLRSHNLDYYTKPGLQHRRPTNRKAVATGVTVVKTYRYTIRYIIRDYPVREPRKQLKMRRVFSFLFVFGHVKCNNADELAYQKLTRAIVQNPSKQYMKNVIPMEAK